MEYKQSIQEYNTSVGQVRLEYTYELHGHVWLLDELYIVVNGQGLHCPALWKGEPTVRLLHKIERLIKAQQDDYCSNAMRR